MSLCFNGMSEPQPGATEIHGHGRSVHLMVFAGFRVFSKISWKICHVFQDIKLSLLGNEISILSLVLGDRLESENGCVWTLCLGRIEKNRLITQEKQQKKSNQHKYYGCDPAVSPHSL